LRDLSAGASVGSVMGTIASVNASRW
jgi:hypothetical protein